jgi:hypothetical protein
LIFLTISGAICLLTLVPFAVFLSNRDETMDRAQLLVITRQPDLLRGISVIAYLVLTTVSFALWRKYLSPEDRKAFFIAALALSPLLVFNQQILTARSLQPFHYEFYVINYLVLMAVVLICAAFFQKFLRQKNVFAQVLLVIIGTASIVWGGIEAHQTTVFWNSTNIKRDQAMPVNRRLRELADGNIEDRQTRNDAQSRISASRQSDDRHRASAAMGAASARFRRSLFLG